MSAWGNIGSNLYGNTKNSSLIQTQRAQNSKPWFQIKYNFDFNKKIEVKVDKKEIAKVKVVRVKNFNEFFTNAVKNKGFSRKEKITFAYMDYKDATGFSRIIKAFLWIFTDKLNETEIRILEEQLKFYKAVNKTVDLVGRGRFGGDNGAYKAFKETMKQVGENKINEANELLNTLAGKNVAAAIIRGGIKNHFSDGLTPATLLSLFQADRFERFVDECIKDGLRPTLSEKDNGKFLDVNDPVVEKILSTEVGKAIFYTISEEFAVQSKDKSGRLASQIRSFENRKFDELEVKNYANMEFILLREKDYSGAHPDLKLKYDEYTGLLSGKNNLQASLEKKTEELTQRQKSFKEGKTQPLSFDQLNLIYNKNTNLKNLDFKNLQEEKLKVEAKIAKLNEEIDSEINKLVNGYNLNDDINQLINKQAELKTKLEEAQGTFEVQKQWMKQGTLENSSNLIQVMSNTKDEYDQLSAEYIAVSELIELLQHEANKDINPDTTIALLQDMLEQTQLLTQVMGTRLPIPLTDVSLAIKFNVKDDSLSEVLTQVANEKQIISDLKVKIKQLELSQEEEIDRLNNVQMEEFIIDEKSFEITGIKAEVLKDSAIKYITTIQSTAKILSELVTLQLSDKMRLEQVALQNRNKLFEEQQFIKLIDDTFDSSVQFKVEIDKNGKQEDGFVEIEL
jgi:hypothetical protein